MTMTGAGSQEDLYAVSRVESWPPGRPGRVINVAEAAYHTARRAAEMALDRGDPSSALQAVAQCLGEADRLLSQAQMEWRQAREEAARVHHAQGQLDAERVELQQERRALLQARDQFSVERARLKEERAALVDAQRKTTGHETRRRARETAPQAIPDMDVDLRPDPRSAATPAEFMGMLRQFKVWAGDPGFRQVAARAAHRYSASALHTAMSHDSLPKKAEVVDTIVHGCGGTDDDRRMWATAWRKLAMQPASGVPLASVLAFPEARDATPQPGPA
jgi:hypothetical protein